jgi:hypothetical protein
MGRFFRDILVDAIAAGVVAAMTILIGKLQGVDPVLLAIVTFIVLLVAFRIVYHLQEKKLKKRLNLDRERWDKVRDERVKLRQQYSNRTAIPDLLYKMSERVRGLMENTSITADENMEEDFRQILQLKGRLEVDLKAGDAKKILEKFPSVKGYKDPIHQMRALVMSVYQVLTAHRKGARFIVEQDGEYQQLDRQIRELLVGLPQSIHVKKDGYTQLVNAYYSLAAVDFSNMELPQIFRLYQPFMKDVVVTELATIRAGISSSIEKFLLGEDIQ